ncbi:hypothetical protein CEXT_743431, partial [Caerostris extrusa]
MTAYLRSLSRYFSKDTPFSISPRNQRGVTKSRERKGWERGE